MAAVDWEKRAWSERFMGVVKEDVIKTTNRRTASGLRVDKSEDIRR